MQIHEITSRPIKEGVLGGIGAALGGIAKASAQKFAQSTLGRDIGGKTLQGGQAAAVKANDPLVKQMSTELLKAWQGGTLPTLMKTATATEPGQLDKRILADTLTRQINQVLGFNYRDLEKMIDPTALDGTAQIEAAAQVDALEKAIDMAASYPPAGSGRTKSKLELAKQFNDIALPMAVALNIKQFNSKSGPGGAPLKVEWNDAKRTYTVGGQPYDPANPTHQEAMASYQNSIKAP